MLICEVHYAAKTGQREAVMALAAPMARATRAEAGNVAYAHYPSLDDEAGVFVFEVWTGEDALRAHNRALHFQAFLRAVRPLLAEGCYRYRIYSAEKLREGDQPLNIHPARGADRMNP